MGEIGDSTKPKALNADVAKPAPEPTLFGDMWQAAKYSAVQKPYDGLRQAANHMGGDVAARQLVDQPVKPTSTAHEIAQGIGDGIGQLPAMCLLYGASKFGIGKLAGESKSTFSVMMRENATVNSLTMSGALYSGLTTVSREDSFLSDRLKATAIGGLTMYTMGTTQLSLQKSVGLAGREFSKDVATNIAQRSTTAGIGLLSGGLGGYVHAESNALLYKHTTASTPEIVSSVAKFGAFGLVFGAAAPLPEEASISPGRTGMSRPPRAYVDFQKGVEAAKKTPKLGDQNEGK